MKKILILGERNTGKSSYLKRLFNMEIREYVRTDGICVFKNINIGYNKGRIEFDIYDCSIPRDTLLDNMDGIIGVLLFLDCGTMCDIKSWVDYAKRFGPIVICNNKIEISNHQINDLHIEPFIGKNVDYTTMSNENKWNLEVPVEKLIQMHLNDYTISLNEKSGKDEAK